MATDILQMSFWFLCAVFAYSAVNGDTIEEKSLESPRNVSMSETLSRSKDSLFKHDGHMDRQSHFPRHQQNQFSDQSPFVPHRAPLRFENEDDEREFSGVNKPTGAKGKFERAKFHVHRDEDKDGFQGGSFTNGGGFDPFKEMQQDHGNIGTGNKIVNINHDHLNVANYPADYNQLYNLPNYQEHTMYNTGEMRPTMPMPRPINAQPALPHHGYMGGFRGHMVHPNFHMHPYRLMPPTPMFRLHQPIYPRPMYNPYYQPNAMRRQDAGSAEDSGEVGQQSNNNNNNNNQTMWQIIAGVPREFIRQVAQQATASMAEDFADFLEDLSPFK